MFGALGVQGGFIGNAGGLMAGLDLPFGGGNQYRQIQKENQPGAPKPTGTSPVRIFPPNAPGREGAIDVQFRQALGGFPQMGNIGGLLAQSNQYPSTPVYFDEQMKQLVPRVMPQPGASTPVKNYPGLGIAPRVPFI